MWAALIVLLGLVCTVPGAPVSVCPRSCSCSAAGTFLEAHCKSFDFLNKPLSPEQINFIVSLDIANASAIKINPNLRALRHLKHLKLASNKIRHFTTASLPKSVEYLDLSQNLIKHLPEDLHLLPDLKEIHLEGNPISCKCDSLITRDSLLKKGVVFKDPPKCESPKEFCGNSWLTVTCKDQIRVLNLFEDMQGDAPYEGSGSGDVSLVTDAELTEKSEEKWDSSIEDEYMRVGLDNETSAQSKVPPSTEAPELEGSGDEPETTTSDFSIVKGDETTQVSIQETTTEPAALEGEDEYEDKDDYEEDYDDDGFTESSAVTEPPVVTEDISVLNRGIKPCHFDCSTSSPIEEDGTDTAPPPGLIEGIRILANDLNILGEDETTTTTTITTEGPTAAPVPPEEISVEGKEVDTDKKPGIDRKVVAPDAEVIDKDLNTDKESGSISESPENSKQSNSTFIFLSVLFLIIICLVGYAVVKKRKMRRARRASFNKKNEEPLGEEMELLKKPVTPADNNKTNGTHETIPLVNGHKENQKNAEEILPADILNNDVKPSDDLEEVELRPKKHDQEHLLTPETKRVTIKASEIPNSTPKTPILVTRHINSDGSIVSTPTPNIDQHV